MSDKKISWNVSWRSNDGNQLGFNTFDTEKKALKAAYTLLTRRGASMRSINIVKTCVPIINGQPKWGSEEVVPGYSLCVTIN